MKNEDDGVIIELRDVKKHYPMGKELVRAVDGLSIKVKKGQFIAIMGPSGSGKSTSMNLVGSLDIPTTGKIFLDGEDISMMEESSLAQIRGKKIGFIFQSFNLIPNLTAKENITLPMMFQGVDVDEREKRAKHLLNLVGLNKRMEHYPNELSGGERQRVAIARALANEPDVILADEPTGNLDTKTGKIVMDFLEELNKQGKTIIMVTHDANLAKEHAEVVYWLKDGKLERISKENKHWSNRDKKVFKQLKKRNN